VTLVYGSATIPVSTVTDNAGISTVRNPDTGPRSTPRRKRRRWTSSPRPTRAPSGG
jgi:hypothetical protein